MHLLVYYFYMHSNLFSEISIDPGEIFSIKVADCPDIKTRRRAFHKF
jgi:hypothetical protein